MKKRENIIIIVVLIVMVIAIIGVSYAVFNYSALGTKVNTITTGSITMSYTEKSNTISLTGALPTTDKTGMVRLNPGEYFDFTVSSKISGNVNINYEITAKDVTDSETRKIDGKYIKLYLTKLNDDGTEEGLMAPETYNEESTSNDYTGRPAGEMSLYTSSMSSSESNTYRLRMYVTEEYNPQGDGGNLQFSVKVNIYGKDGETMNIADTLLMDKANNINKTDPKETFITGENPNNYIWYSGKLWRAVAIDPSDNSVKMITEETVTAIAYNESGNNNYIGSYIEDWLNDTTVDGFLGNLRDANKYIKMDSVFDSSPSVDNLEDITRPNGTNASTSAVGLLNIYEMKMACSGVEYKNCYLPGDFYWATLSTNSVGNLWYSMGRKVNNGLPAEDTTRMGVSAGARPVVNLKGNIKIAAGTGTESDPYRLDGDNDKNLNGTKLSTRYSGEYIRFGEGYNNLYRIVSKESGTTKVTSYTALDPYDMKAFGNNNIFSSTNTIGSFLNNDFLNPTNGYLSAENIEMIKDDTTWYLGKVSDRQSYKLAKYQDTTGSTLTSNVTTAKVGLLRYGELLSGLAPDAAMGFWLITPDTSSKVYVITDAPIYNVNDPTWLRRVRPAFNLKENVIITNGDGTKDNPFELKLAIENSN